MKKQTDQTDRKFFCSKGCFTYPTIKELTSCDKGSLIICNKHGESMREAKMDIKIRRNLVRTFRVFIDNLEFIKTQLSKYPYGEDNDKTDKDTLKIFNDIERDKINKNIDSLINGVKRIHNDIVDGREDDEKGKCKYEQ